MCWIRPAVRGFLVETLNYLNTVFHEEKRIKAGDENTEEFVSIRDRLANYAAKNLFGADFDPSWCGLLR